jgi:hypothetical protein
MFTPGTFVAIKQPMCKPEDGIVTVSNLEQIINIFTLQEGENALRVS